MLQWNSSRAKSSLPVAVYKIGAEINLLPVLQVMKSEVFPLVIESCVFGTKQVAN